MNDYARKYNILKENDKNLSGEDVRGGTDGGHQRQAARGAV